MWWDAAKSTVLIILAITVGCCPSFRWKSLLSWWHFWWYQSWSTATKFTANKPLPANIHQEYPSSLNHQPIIKPPLNQSLKPSSLSISYYSLNQSFNHHNSPTNHHGITVAITSACTAAVPRPPCRRNSLCGSVTMPGFIRALPWSTLGVGMVKNG